MRRLLLVVILSVLLLLVAAPARATTSTAITITTHIVFPFPAPPHGTFKASAPLCASGTFVDDILAGLLPPGSPGSGTFAVLVRKTLTCDDGSGTITLQFHPQFNPPETSVDGPWMVFSGTGAFTTLHGSGTFSEFPPPPTPTGVETFTGKVHFD